MITAVDTFDDQFAALVGSKPFRWQRRLFERLVNSEVPTALDLPTGLGKTSVMAIWLIARAHGAKLPRRLIYVVDRRAVVDQATAEAEKLRRGLDDKPDLKARLGLDGRSLPISTLRGQFVDNRDWLVDPAAPAIVVGTVDMIGSRLLFSGYGVSSKMRPYHAGFLGADALVVLDEAHLVPSFEKLLETIRHGAEILGARSAADREIVPAFRLLPLSATGRPAGRGAFRLEAEDREDDPVAKRLTAFKALTIDNVETGKLAERLADDAWALTRNGTAPLRCVVYCHRREDAEKAKERLDKLAASDKKYGPSKAATELFVGARRVWEREDANNWLKRHGFLAGSDVPRERPAILVATSAGEVGVDLDADHMVCDLVPWERMVQRLGRVNRLGKRDDTEVFVLVGTEKETDERLVKTQALLEKLPEMGRGRNASPGALLALREEAGPEAVTAASTPAPLHPALTRALADAWSMTSLPEHTGRPEIDPWLRGWVEDEKPQTSVVWRTHLPVRTEGGDASLKEVEDFFEAAPPHASEILETDTWRVVDWLMARASASETENRRMGHGGGADTVKIIEEKTSEETARTLQKPLRGNDIVAFALTSTGDFGESYRLNALAEGDKKLKSRLNRDLADVTLVVDARMGGMLYGLLNDGAKAPPPTADDDGDWLPSTDERPIVRFRIHPPATLETARIPAHEIYRFATKRSKAGEDEEILVVETWMTEESRAASTNPQLLTEHQSWTEQRARAIAEAVGLVGDHKEALAAAARLHDEGKRAARWQHAFNAPHDGKVYAKTKGPISYALLDGYRHEFGSLPCVEKDVAFDALPRDLQDLVLHLVAAHHGRARPLIETTGCEDAPPSALKARARDVALRFARLQKRWGPWGLAWWEALLRAADQQASRKNDDRSEEKAKPPKPERVSDGRS